MLFGAGDGHVEEAALLLQGAGRIHGACAGEEVLLHAHHEDVAKLQPLGRVNGHQGDALLTLLVIAVLVAQQRDL